MYCLEIVHHLGPEVDFRAEQGLNFKNILKVLMLLLVRSSGSTDEYSQRVQNQILICLPFIRECRKRLTKLRLLESHLQMDQHKHLQRLNPRSTDTQITRASSLLVEFHDSQPKSRFFRDSKPVRFSVYDTYKESGDENTLRCEDFEESLESLLHNFPTETPQRAAEPVDDTSARPPGPATSPKSLLNQVIWTKLTGLVTAVQQVKTCTWFVISFCGVVFLGSVLSIWWSIWRSDISGGFTMGAFITGAGCGTVNKLHNQHRDDGRCQCTQESLDDQTELDTISLRY